MAQDRFTRNTFDAVEFLMESVEKPKIKFGGSSSSTTLNRFFNKLSQDIALMITRTNSLASRAARLEAGMIAQDGALSSAFQAVSSRVDAASAYDQVLAEFWNGVYVDETSATAEVDHDFGQVTLPIQSTTDLLVHQDVYGNTFISPEVEIAWATGAEPGTLDFQRDHPDGLRMLQGLQTWLLAEYDGTVWVKIKGPLQFRGLSPNVLELWPFPAFGVDLLEVAYQRAGTSFSSTWIALDLSYLPGYNTGTGEVDQSGPVRLHLPGEGITSIRIKMRTRSSTAWGMHKVKLYHRQYASSGNLTVKDPYSRTVGDIILRGKDPSELSELRTSKIGNSVTVNLTTTDATRTPVLTGILMNVS